MTNMFITKDNEDKTDKDDVASAAATVIAVLVNVKDHDADPDRYSCLARHSSHRGVGGWPAGRIGRTDERTDGPTDRRTDGRIGRIGRTDG